MTERGPDGDLDEFFLDGMPHHERSVDDTRSRRMAREAARFFDRNALRIGCRRTLCALEWATPYWVAEVDEPFRPEGLLVVRAPAGARLKEWIVGHRRDLPAGKSSIDLSTFTLLNAEDAKAYRPHFDTLNPGIIARLSIVKADGSLLTPPDAELTLWGLCAKYV